MLSFHRAVADDFEAVNQLIIAQVKSHVDLVEDIGNYLIEAGGKRLRPLLVLLTANALGYQAKEHHDLAAIIEFIHSATLLHDDVVDTSDLRRGRLTANAKWGNPPSVLVGDFLYSRSFQMMVKLGNMEIMSILSDTTNTISEGEVQQLVNAGNPEVDEDNYFNVIHKKTAALFEAACSTAAVLCGSDKQTQQALHQYGYHLGMAFQLVDDALDYSGASEKLGKNVGDDLAEGKPTLPLIYTMENAAESADAELIRQSLRAAEPMPEAQLQQIIDMVKNSGAIEYTQEKAEAHIDQAKANIAFLPDSIYKTAMLELAEFALNRDH